MKNFWKFLLRKDLPPDSLENLKYTIFGLGDSSYEKFNSTAKLLNIRLKQLSAQEFHPVGLGDDQHDFGYEGEFDPWCAKLLEELKSHFPSKYLLYEELPITPKYNTTIYENISEFLKSEDAKIYKLKENSQGILDIDDEQNDKRKPYIGNINNYKYLSSDNSEKKIIHLEIDIKPTSKKEIFPYYKTGDIAVIYPKNDEPSIDKFLKLTNLDKENIIVITKNGFNKTKYHQIFPKVISVRELLSDWLDINGIPNRHFCRIAYKYTYEEIHREKLELFASKTSVNLFMIF